MLRERPLVWSEEELRYLDPPPARVGPQSLAGPLRGRLAAVPAAPYETTRSSIIHRGDGRTHGNFIDASYRRILGNPAWARRLTKAHTAKRQARAIGPNEEVRAWCELDAATSSDALLMNIFCYPRVLASGALTALLGVAAGLEPEFGYRPGIPLGVGSRKRVLKDRSEIDMRLGHLLVEAKLTENDFQTAPLRMVERYPGFDEVFDRAMLGGEMVRGYQVIRGVLAAEFLGGETGYCVFVDARRRDLMEAWFSVICAVRRAELRSRLRLLTWQEIARTLPVGLREFLDRKYGIR